jgi:hypothetical protein
VTISTDEDLALISLRETLAEAIAEGVPSLRVTTDPRNANPPCVLVSLPELRQISNVAGSGVLHVDVDVPINLLAVGPANDDAAKWLLGKVLPVMFAVNARDAVPARDAETGELLPAYVITVNKKLTAREDGS